MSTTSGVKAGPLAMLEETLWEWTLAQERSSRLWGWDDVPWWYGERASLSVLAGAIWRSGGIALEEYSVTKTRRREDGQKGLIQGRNDLYFRIGRHDFVLEAKAAWPKLRSKEPLKDITVALENAERDVESVQQERVRRLAVAFIAPSYPKGYEEKCDSLIDSWISELRGLSGVAAAWIFPDGARQLFSKDAGHYYPGAAIVLKEI
jgi:hypothetical protein